MRNILVGYRVKEKYGKYIQSPSTLSTAKRTLDAAGTLVFFVFYNFVEGKIVEVYDNSDDDLLKEVGEQE